MENLRIEGLVVIEDCFFCDGERLLASLAAAAVKKLQFKVVRLLLLNARKAYFQRKYPQLEALGIKIEEAESLCGVSAPSCSEESTCRSALFFDTITDILRFSSCDGTLRMLKCLARRGPVISRVYGEELSEDCRRRLTSVADVFLKLSLSSNGSALCEFYYFKKTGKRVLKKQTFHVDDDLKLSAREYKESTVSAVGSVENTDWELPGVPFDLGLKLSENERKAKESLELPYMAAQFKNGLGISASGDKKVRVGGRVIYTPDEADDFDDSDPDEDLQI